ncbi:MAG: PaeR7I family type II restriction endonuclease [Candidatus Eisenbacteria bacterium]
MNDFRSLLEQAIRHFWTTRERQSRDQGSKSGQKDAGARSAVTGGAQMDGFVTLVRDLLVGGGVPEASVYCKRNSELPGFYRPEKQWDLLIVLDHHVVATIEFKSQVGSFGNNYNNRTEEAIGNAVDLRTAYRDGAFKPSADPWLGYLMLLEDATGSRRPVGVREPHFKVFEEFRDASYARRYELLLTKLVRERLYNAACFLLSDRADGPRGVYTEPSEELAFRNFAASLLAHATAYMKTRGE